jgi:hypothetical protein
VAVEDTGVHAKNRLIHLDSLSKKPETITILVPSVVLFFGLTTWHNTVLTYSCIEGDSL